MIRLYNAGAVTSSRLESYWGYVSHTCLKNVRCSWQWVLFMNVCSACVWCEEVGEDWATVIAMWELIGRESMGAFQQIAAFAAEEIKRALQHSDVGAFVPAHACVVSEASQWMGLLLTNLGDGHCWQDTACLQTYKEVNGFTGEYTQTYVHFSTIHRSLRHRT